jgi:hypothetical protein
VAIVRVQASPVGLALASAPVSTSFAVLPAAGNLIRVAVAMTGNLGSENVTIADNQGNTYTKAADSGNLNDLRAQIWYTYNIGAPAGTFTVTATALGANQATLIQAKEASGFSSVDPLDGTAVNGANSNAPVVGPTAPVGVAEVLVDALCGSYQVIANVEVVVPAWNVDGTFSGFETDSRIVTDMGAQSCAWALAGSAIWVTCIAAFAAAPPVPEARWTQAGRYVMWVDDPTEARLTQMARYVMYPFTCVPGPPPPIPTPAGCPDIITLLPVTGRAGCADEV